MTLENSSYVDFTTGLMQRTVGSRVPLLASFEVSHRCPLDCSHCYNNLPMADAEASRQELSFEEYRRILDELADLGCMWITFTGGEIFARRDFLEVYTYAKRKGFIVTLYTNGTMITPKVADYLAEWAPFKVEITLYGRTRETYERLTRIPGSYDRCMRGIQLLRERSIRLEIKTVVVSVNRHELWDMQKFAEEVNGQSAFRLDPMINPRIDCSASPLEVRLTPEEVLEIDFQHPTRREEWARFSARFTGLPPPSTGAEHPVYNCGGGLNSFNVDPQGRMTICVISHVDKYDLRHGTVREGWEQFLRKVRERTTVRVTKCTSCQIKSMCGMCPANGELDSGDAESPVDFLCHTAHLRAETLGLAVPAHGDCEYCPGGSRRATIEAEAERLRSGVGSAGRPVPVLLPAVSRSEPGASTVGGCSGGACGG